MPRIRPHRRLRHPIPAPGFDSPEHGFQEKTEPPRKMGRVPFLGTGQRKGLKSKPGGMQTAVRTSAYASSFLPQGSTLLNTWFRKKSKAQEKLGRVPFLGTGHRKRPTQQAQRSPRNCPPERLRIDEPAP